MGPGRNKANKGLSPPQNLDFPSASPFLFNSTQTLTVLLNPISLNLVLNFE